jgi:hypothetical protein
MRRTQWILGAILAAATAALPALAGPDNAAIEAQFRAAKDDPAARAKIMGGLMAPEVTYSHNYVRPEDGKPMKRDEALRMTMGSDRPAGAAATLPYTTDDWQTHVSDGAIVFTWRMTARNPEVKPGHTLVTQIWQRNKDGKVVAGTVYYDMASMSAVTRP